MSKEKRRVPKLRFPGFTEDWEQRKLGDYLTIPEKEILEVASVNDLITVKLNLGGVESGASRDTLSLGSTVYYKRYAGQFIYGKQNFFNGSMGLIPKNLDGKGSSGDVPSFNVSNIEANYLYTYVSRESYWRLKVAAASGTGSKRIHEKTFLDFNIDVPSLDEQKLISNTFDLVNRFITLHQRKLNNLKLKKKALLQKLFPKNGERYPELRFSGFTDAWEQCKLGEIFEYLQNNTLSRDSLNYRIPNIKNIHYGDILVKFNEILDGSNKDIPYINPDLDLSKFSKSLLRDGDVIFSDTAEDDTVGKAIELQNVNAPFILSGLHTIPCRPLIPFGKGYLGNFFNSNSYRLQIRPLVQGIKVSSISKSALKDTMIKYPKNLDEQEKIGSLFQSITKMITLHQRKLDHLQLQKKALLQQMFV